MSHVVPSSNPSRFDEDLDPPVNNNEEDSPPNKFKGRKKGARGWVKSEIDALLDIIKSILPCGSKQWDLVSLELLDYGFKERDGESCKCKFERLWTKERPTGTSEIPLHITRAKDIKDNIMSAECMGHSSLNNTDNNEDEDEKKNGDDSSAKSSAKAFKGTNLSSSAEWRPATKKRKQEMLNEAINGLAQCQERGFDSLSEAIRELSRDKTENNLSTLNNRVDKIEKNIKNVDTTLLKILEKLG